MLSKMQNYDARIMDKTAHLSLKSAIFTPLNYRSYGAKVANNSWNDLLVVCNEIVPIARWLVALDQLADAFRGDQIKDMMYFDPDLKASKSASVPPKKARRPGTAVSPKKPMLGAATKVNFNNPRSFMESEAFLSGIVELKSYVAVAKPISDVCLAVEIILANKPMGEIQCWARFKKLNSKKLAQDVQ